MRRKIIALLAATTLLGMLDQSAEAQLFRRRRQRSQVACPGGVCPTRTTPGLTINDRGGFEGQLPDSYYQERVGIPTVAAPTVAVQPTPTLAPVPTQVVQRSIVVAVEPECPIEAAAARLAKLQVEMEEAEIKLRAAQISARQQELIAEAEAEAAARVAQIEAAKQSTVAALQLETEVRSQEAELELKLARLREMQAENRQSTPTVVLPGPK